jgi:hypothetical protein
MGNTRGCKVRSRFGSGANARYCWRTPFDFANRQKVTWFGMIAKTIISSETGGKRCHSSHKRLARCPKKPLVLPAPPIRKGTRTCVCEMNWAARSSTRRLAVPLRRRRAPSLGSKRWARWQPVAQRALCSEYSLLVTRSACGGHLAPRLGAKLPVGRGQVEVALIRSYSSRRSLYQLTI